MTYQEFFKLVLELPTAGMKLTEKKSSGLIYIMSIIDFLSRLTNRSLLVESKLINILIELEI